MGGRPRGRALTLSGPVRFSNEKFEKELDEIRNVLRTSHSISSSEEKEKEDNINNTMETLSVEDANQTIEQLRLQLQDALNESQQLATELRIERNLRLDLEKENQQLKEKLTSSKIDC